MRCCFTVHVSSGASAAFSFSDMSSKKQEGSHLLSHESSVERYVSTFFLPGVSQLDGKAVVTFTHDGVNMCHRRL